MSKRVVVALSGGVDSATAAALLVERGYDVIGMTMRLYDAGGTSESIGGRCCGPRDIEDARRVCEHLQIPHYVLDFSVDFEKEVMDNFAASYLAGETPNPCARCNQSIKFTPLLNRARQLGIDTVVTGHYAQMINGARGRELHRGVDTSKDQSYFLFAMPKQSLEFIEFPLGELTKDEVRALAARHDLPNAQKKDSQEICFVPDGDYAGFVAAHSLKRKRTLPVSGNFIDTAGNVLGQHDGIHHFTVGQRKGLGHITGSEVRYVVDIDPRSQTVTVGNKDDASGQRVLLSEPTWLGEVEPGETLLCQVRYRAKPIEAKVHEDSGETTIELAEPVICAPGQAAVLYRGSQVVGGGWIKRSHERN